MHLRLTPLLFLLLIAACGQQSSGKADSPAPKAAITLFAAASMTDALNEAASAFEAKTGHGVKASYGGSDVLANQVLSGAEVDVFVSASASWMKKVADGGALAEPDKIIAGNRLVCVIPADSAALDAGPESLRADRFKVLAIADASVPAGKYARQALEKLALLEDLKSRLVGLKDVRAVLRAVAQGEAEAGFVYSTDAKIEPRTRVAFEFDASLHERILYPAGVIKAGKGREAAREFLDFLLSPEGQAIFKKHGFAPPSLD